MVSSYRPLVSSSRLWLTALALCFHISEASARSHYHPAPQVCYNQNNQRIPCPKKTKKQWLIGVIIAASGVIIIGCIFYFCCAVGECACATCAACCCLCCSKRKKTSGGQVYQTLPDQGNNATIVSPCPLDPSLIFIPLTFY
ncbi:hypothetical protein BDY19DRAFT_415236 [Irpex rosettiformis]|uniref:Uncharacterized protein n=1 Tax=Irpex rosettiformis TaxID=378272 RepID=A0ACB8UG10_9APHY|nr:hypothetical protein BDY19DRAFT_415236 [Irpex rosettiformis]